MSPEGDSSLDPTRGEFFIDNLLVRLHLTTGMIQRSEIGRHAKEVQ
jgi:hypothetical protein